MFWSVPEMMIISLLFLIDISLVYSSEKREKIVILLLLGCRLLLRSVCNLHYSSWKRKKNSVIPSAWLLAELLLNMDAVAFSYTAQSFPFF
jgi:hypothetical protein